MQIKQRTTKKKRQSVDLHLYNLNKGTTKELQQKKKNQS